MRTPIRIWLSASCSLARARTCRLRRLQPTTRLIRTFAIKRASAVFPTWCRNSSTAKVPQSVAQPESSGATNRQKSQSFLIGRIFDARGNRMTQSHAVRNGLRYRYYISSALIQAQPDMAATLNRVPASEIETLITGALRKHLAEKLNNKVEARCCQLL